MFRKKKDNTKEKKTVTKKPVEINNQQRLIIGSFITLLGIFSLISFISYFFSANKDQSILNNFNDKTVEADNLLSKLGAFLGDLFIKETFGVSSIIIISLIIVSGVFVLNNSNKNKLFRLWFWGLYNTLWLSLLFGFTTGKYDYFGGKIGFETNQYLQIYIGKIGVAFIVVFLVICYLAIRLRLTPNHLFGWAKKTHSDKTPSEQVEENIEDPITNIKPSFSDNDEEKPVEKENIETSKEQESIIINSKDEEIENPISETPISEIPIAKIDKTDTNVEIGNEITFDKEESTTTKIEEQNIEEKEEIKEDFEDFEVIVSEKEEELTDVEAKSKQLVEDFGEFDPTLELSNFEFPKISLLKQYDKEQITINKEELEENKNKIENSLNNFKIGISSIKAAIGPTVTLYEIVPEAGIRISKIKNLEDDIALSLSALGIRIIAPMPGRGTVGIEVPNKKPQMVSMRSTISSPSFQEAKMELPIAFGKNISNETVVVDLAKMPHLLMAGATGQGKSVGLNCILTSLLYKKHPAEVKFVLVDPKKVELTLFNKIERHYLARLPDSEEAIITDNSKVINTLNSLCIEMDNRYELLKNAFCRNIVEYNKKFKERKLNPNDGHKFLPYIVLVVDEFADLIMTAGKEVETPIARLAQLARAIGIHLIIATQRPSVNVITGMIKANFPARVAFRVMTGIDSKTILDTGGANQLIGRGDMLYTQGNELIRIQCAFVDTPEVEKITEYIGSQKAYPSAYELPEYVGEEGGTTLDVDISDRDKLFREAAEVLVTAQQGSASLLQRKLKLGYNRAGRLIDQLEAAGIVGPFEGSKARQVLVTDLVALEELLKNE